MNPRCPLEPILIKRPSKREFTLVLVGLAVCLVGPFGLRAAQPDQDPPIGLWYGVLATGVKEFRLGLRVEIGPDQGLRVEMISLDQHSALRPATAASFKNGQFRADFAKSRATFEGTVKGPGFDLAGKWTQGGVTYPLTFKKVDHLPETRRFQEPQRPFPYSEREARIENARGGVTLSGTLTLPKGPGLHPAVILISGSGPQDRDQTVFGHKPFLVLADRLTRDGVAVLRIDDRGVGGSTGSTALSTLHDLAGDIEAAFLFLSAQPGIDPKRIGLIGHSEGGLVAPLVVCRQPTVAFMVLLAAPGISGEEICLLQAESILKSAALPEEYISWNRNLLRRVLTILKSESDDTKVKEKALVAFQEEITRAGLGHHPRLSEFEAAFLEQVRKTPRPATRALLAHDTRATLQKVRCPVLALNGEKDVQVPPQENLRAITEAFRIGGNQRVSIQELPGLNHLFQTCKTGSMTEYAQIEETFSPRALDTVSSWISATLRP